MTVLTNKELVDIYAEKTGMGKGETDKHLKDTFATLAEIVSEYGAGFKFGDFGTFDVVVASERDHRNPKTGETITKPAHNALKFKQNKGEKSIKKKLEALEV